MIPVVIIVIDEGFDLLSQVSRQKVILQQNAILQGLMPATSLFDMCWDCEEEDSSDMSILEQALSTREEREKYKELLSLKDGITISTFELVNDECSFKDG